MSIEQFDYFPGLIGPHIVRQNTDYFLHHMQIWPSARFALFRWFFGRSPCFGTLRHIATKTQHAARRSATLHGIERRRIRSEHSFRHKLLL